MPAASVKTYEQNLVQKIGGQTGVYNAIVIPAKKGPINVPVLVTSENDLLNKFTPDNTIKVGYNLAYYSALTALEKTRTMWVIRTANGALNGGAFVKKVGSASLTPYVQVNETAPSKKAIVFTASNIVDGSNEITISSLTGGVSTDLVGRSINIPSVGQGSFVVSSVTGSVATLTTSIDSAISFTGTGTASIVKSSDYATFDVSFVSGATYNITNIVDGVGSSVIALADFVGSTLSFIVSGVSYTRTVLSATGTTATLSSALPTMTTGTGYRGNPLITMNVSGVADGTGTIQVSDIFPTYIATTSVTGKILQVSASMTNGTSSVSSATISSATGVSVTLDTFFNNPALVDTAPASAPETDAVALGFTDASPLPFSVDDCILLYSVNEGNWSKDIRVEIVTQNQKLPGTFTVNVFSTSNLVKPRESFICSRDIDARDGFGRNIYIETVLTGSNYINAISNQAIPADVLPKEVLRTGSLIRFVGGNDGGAVTDSDMIVSASLMANKNNYPLTVFLDGGWSSSPYQNKISQICEERDDSIAVLTVPFELGLNPVTYLSDIVNYRTTDLNINSSYAALYTSHIKITDKYNNREIFIAPDGFAAAAISISASEYEIWYPAAGFNRGRLFVNDVQVKFTDGDLDVLSDNGINPIRFSPGKGVAIWGQHTLTYVATAVDRMNVRLLLNKIKPEISTFLERYLFELNTTDVRASVEGTINGYLTGIHARNGISAFSVVCDDTNNSPQDTVNNILNVDIYVKPVYSIEYINFTTVINNGTVSFS